jgi:hypothetical protein
VKVFTSARLIQLESSRANKWTASVRRDTEKMSCPFKKIFLTCAKSEIVRNIFLRGTRAKRAEAGRFSPRPDVRQSRFGF